MQNFLRLYRGRISRSTFFSGWLLFVVGATVFALVALVVTDGLSKGGALTVVFLLSLLAVLYFYLFSIVVRRLHDVNGSGWFALLMLIGPVNLIMVAILSLLKGEEKENKYGKPPHKQFDLLRLFK